MMQINISHKEIEKFCVRNGIRWFAIFGSAIQGIFKAESDVDVLVEFDKPKGLFELVRIEDEMSSLFGGRKVDLVVKNGLDKYIRDEVLKSCEVIYGKAG
jgi:uncharacterized protein